jgi:hypothetical protein
MVNKRRGHQEFQTLEPEALLQRETCFWFLKPKQLSDKID